MYTNGDIIQEIRRVASVLQKESVTVAEFKRHGKISDTTVTNHFGSWNAAVSAAGLTPIDRVEAARDRPSLSEDELLLDLLRLYKESGQIPTKAIINSEGKYSEFSYRKRWGGHRQAFAVACKRFPQARPEVAQSSSPPAKNMQREVKIVPQTIKPRNEKRRRTVFGEPIDFRGLRFAPVNEQGVVYLFGMISHELGYLIESVRTSFPDCEGKRCFDKNNNQWEHIQIEFEYKTSNFLEHGHDPENCDVIICWVHDWDDCPIEVLELRSVIKYL
jgi:hypothetical protein